PSARCVDRISQAIVVSRAGGPKRGLDIMAQAPETPSLATNGKQQPTDGEAALRDEFEVWERRNQEAFRTETKEKFVSDEGLEVKRVYTPLDMAEQGFDYRNDLGLPGAYPYTRA